MNDQSHRKAALDRPENLAALVRLIADRAANSTAHKAKICFWLGAGADISSGGLSFGDLKRQTIEEFSKARIFDVTVNEEIEARFEDLFARLPPDERALLVESVLRRMQPL